MLALLIFLVATQAPMAPVPDHVPARQPPGRETSPSSSVPEVRELTGEESAALPPGEGRDAVAFMCVPCHGVLSVVAQRKTPLAWVASVEDMRSKGARGTDEQAQAAARYLSANFPAVDVNKATVEQLVKIAGFTTEEAAAIVASREAGQTFKSFTDVRKVPGLDPKRLAAAKPRLAYAPK